MSDTAAGCQGTGQVRCRCPQAGGADGGARRADAAVGGTCPLQAASVRAVRGRRVLPQALPRIRFIFVPHTGQVPCAMRRPDSLTLTSPSKSRFSLHFTQ